MHRIVIGTVGDLGEARGVKFREFTPLLIVLFVVIESKAILHSSEIA